MKLTLELDRELEYAIALHLETGIAVRTYIQAAILYFNRMHEIENGDNEFATPMSCGVGEKSRFSSYNTVISPKEFLDRSIRNG